MEPAMDILYSQKRSKHLFKTAFLLGSWGWVEGVGGNL